MQEGREKTAQGDAYGADNFGFQIFIWGTYRSGYENRRQVSNKEAWLEEEGDLQSGMREVWGGRGREWKVSSRVRGFCRRGVFDRYVGLCLLEEWSW